MAYMDGPGNICASAPISALSYFVTAGSRELRRDRFADDESFLAAYERHLAALLERYGPGGRFFAERPEVPNRPLRFVEIWNEPNFQYMIPDDPHRPRAELEAERAALYAKLLPRAFGLVKARWPDVRAIGFSAGGSAAADARWFRAVLDLDPAVARAFDIASTHPYVQPAPPEAHSIRKWGSYSIASSLAAVRAVLAAHGRGDAPIWYTEIGWPISKADGGYFDDAPNAVFVSPELQAAYVVRTYAWALRLGVDHVFVMFTTDSDRFNAGFFTRSGAWRPSAHAVQTMIRQMPHPHLLGALSDGDEGNFIYRFSPRAGDDVAPTIVAWRVTGMRRVRVPIAGARARVTDMLGGEEIVPTAAGAVEIEIGPLPVYVTPAP
jgi:hypothetical protein